MDEDQGNDRTSRAGTSLVTDIKHVLGLTALIVGIAALVAGGAAFGGTVASAVFGTAFLATPVRPPTPSGRR